MSIFVWLKSKTSEIRKRKRIAKLSSKLGDSNPDVCKAAAEALGEIKDPRAVKALIELLDDRILPVRSAAQQALITTGDLSVEPLIAVLKNDNPSIQWTGQVFV
jgi:HEAT repeat protein